MSYKESSTMLFILILVLMFILFVLILIKVARMAYSRGNEDTIIFYSIKLETLHNANLLRFIMLREDGTVDVNPPFEEWEKLSNEALKDIEEKYIKIMKKR